MIGRQNHHHVAAAHDAIEQRQQVAERLVEPQHHVLHLPRAGSVQVVGAIERREAEREQIGHVVFAELLTLDRGLRELDHHLVHHRARREGRVRLRAGRWQAARERVGEHARHAVPVGLERALVFPAVLLHGPEQLPLLGVVPIGELLVVEGLHPGRHGLSVIRAGHEAAELLVKPPRLAELARHRDRRARLAREGQRLASAPRRCAQPVRQGLGQEVRGRDVVVADGRLEDRVVRVGEDRVELAGGAVEDLVRDDAVPPRVGAGDERRVARAGDALGELVVHRGHEGAFVDQPREAALQPRPVFLQHVGAQRVDADEDRQARRPGEGGEGDDDAAERDEAAHHGAAQIGRFRRHGRAS